jgi:intein/homing endonuclease
MSKFEDKEYYEINLDNGKQINITAEHPVLVIRDSKLGWSRVDELTMADRLLCVEDFNEI